MKRTILFAMVAVLLFSNCGCAVNKDPGAEMYKNDYFAVKEYNGERYIDFHSNSYRAAADTYGQSDLLGGEGISFKSVKEMKESVEQGKFTEKQLILMQSFAKASNGKIAVFDTNKLYDVKLPEDTTLSKIYWWGSTYSFIAESDSASIKIALVTKESWDDYVASWDVENNSNLKVVSKEVEDDGTTTIVYDNLSFSYRSRIVYYTVTDDNGSITYMENYDYEKSEEIPWGITFWGEKDGVYFYAYVTRFEETPSKEWLTSFAVVPYSEK